MFSSLTERPGREVVDAAGAVGDVGHDHALGAGVPLQDVRDGGGEEGQPLRQLQGHPPRAQRANPKHGLGDLEVVVGREGGDVPAKKKNSLSRLQEGLLKRSSYFLSSSSLRISSGILLALRTGRYTFLSCLAAETTAVEGEEGEGASGASEDI